MRDTILIKQLREQLELKTKEVIILEDMVKELFNINAKLQQELDGPGSSLF